MIKFIAHRGNGTNKYVENTASALLGSLELKEVDGVELDIRMTRDKQFVIYHDFLIKDDRLPIRNISSLTLAEVKKYRLNNKDVHVDTLVDFLDKVKSKKKIMIEIKEESNNYDELLVILNSILEKYKHLNILVFSFNYNLMNTWQKKYPEYNSGLLISDLVNNNYLNNTFDFIALSYHYLDKWDFKKITYFWTINSTSKLKNIINKHKDCFVITNKPVKLFNYLDEVSK